tara:strand:- start:5537 stop:6223 length:687 start_codon:yes stop_codon:yes gene_type:complete
MHKSLKVSGMTCKKCENYIVEKISSYPDVISVEVELKKGHVMISSATEINEQKIQELIGNKYLILSENNFSEESKLMKLRPLFLIFIYLVLGALYLNQNSFELKNLMIDFMGLFFITFSFFKFLDYSTFPNSFSNYDPLAKKFNFYGKIYPFIELILGISFLFSYQLKVISVITLIVLGITTFGVAKSIFRKSDIQCACLGTSMNLPMTEATLIENILMISMALGLLI